MSIFKDWREDTRDYRFRTQVTHLFSPKEWSRLHRWRKQRADRGWSDRDTWNAGDHIAEITSEMLQHLIDHGHCDWPEWFKMNVQEEGKDAYKNLQSVVDDINGYIDITEKSWADELYTEPVEGDMFAHTWHYASSGRKLNEAEITDRIKSHAEKELKLYKKAKKGMGFFARHFTGFWD